MNERCKIELRELVTKIKSKQKTEHIKSVDRYYTELSLRYASIDNTIILESIKIYNDNPEMFEEKPLIYFMKIVENKIKERERKKEKESNTITGVPNLNK